MRSPEPGPLRFDLRSSARLLWRRRRWLAGVHLGAAALSTAIVCALPSWYSSAVTLVPAPQGGLSVDLTGSGPGISAATIFSSGPTPQDQLKMVVLSRAVADSLVDAFGLRARWGVRRRDQARERLSDHTTVTTPKQGQVVVSVEATNPALARALAAGYAEYAAREGIRLKTSLAGQRRVYLEGRLRELDRDIDRAGERLRRFEEGSRAISLPDQARETVNAYGALRTQKALLETDLAAARRYFTDRSPEIASLRDQIAELDRQIEKLSRDGDPLQPRGSALPALRQQYLELAREQASLVAVGEVLRKLYEQARVEEANPVPAFAVLDAAEVPERRSRPRRALTIGVALGLCVVGSTAWLHRAERSRDDERDDLAIGRAA